MLEVEVFEHAFAAMLIADAALLAAAIGRVHDAGVDIVDGDVAIVEPRREVANLIHVLGVDIAGKAVRRVVGELDRFVQAIEGHDADQRAERLLAHHFHRMRAAGNHGRAEEMAARESLAFRRTAARDQPRALGERIGQMLAGLVAAARLTPSRRDRRRAARCHCRSPVFRPPPPASARNSASIERCDIDAIDGDADLAHVAERAPHRALDRRVEIGATP